MSLEDVKSNVLGEAADEEARAPQKSAATLLVELARSLYTLGVSEAGEAFARPKDGPPVTLMLRGGRVSLRAQLARTYFRERGKAPPQQALSDSRGQRAAHPLFALLVRRGHSAGTQ